MSRTKKRARKTNLINHAKRHQAGTASKPDAVSSERTAREVSRQKERDTQVQNDILRAAGHALPSDLKERNLSPSHLAILRGEEGSRDISVSLPKDVIRLLFFYGTDQHNTFDISRAPARDRKCQLLDLINADLTDEIADLHLQWLVAVDEASQNAKLTTKREKKSATFVERERYIKYYTVGAFDDAETRDWYTRLWDHLQELMKGQPLGEKYAEARYGKATRQALADFAKLSSKEKQELVGKDVDLETISAILEQRSWEHVA